MKLIDCVESLSTKTLSKILQHHPPYCIDSEVGSELSFLLDQDYIRNLWADLSQIEHGVLAHFMRNIKNYMLPYNQIKNVFSQYKYGEVIIALTRLRQKGLIFTHRRFHGEVAFFMPEDLRLAFLEMIYNQVSEDSRPMNETYYYGNPFFEDLWILLQFITTNPLPLTQRGLIHRRLIPRIEERLRLEQDGFASWSIQYEGAELYSIPLILLLDFAIYYQLLGEYNDTLVVNEDVKDKWLQLTPEKSVAMLTTYLQEQIAPSLTSEVILFLDWLSFIPRGDWFSSSGFKEFVTLVIQAEEGEHKNSFSHDDFFNQIIKPFRELGLIQVREYGDEAFIGKSEYRVDEAAKGYLQPDLHIIVPAFMPMIKRWQLHQVSELISRDQMFTYEITKDSFERALEIGWKLPDLLLLLQELCYDIPTNVTSVLETWSRGYGQFTFMDVMVLECRDEQLAEELWGQPIYQDHIIGRLSPRHFIINPNRVKALQKSLIEGGYSPLKEILKPGIEEQRSIYSSSPLLKPRLLMEPRIENIYPELEDVFHGLETIQRAWLENFRTYHMATLIDMINKSIQFDLKLTLMFKGELWEHIKPLNIQTVGGNYLLQAEAKDGQAEEVTHLWFPIEEIGKIRLHFPY